MSGMENAHTSRQAVEPGRDHPTTASEQLTLLPNPQVNPRFLLSRDTRERGLRHIAEIRRMLAERSADHRRAA